MDIDTNMKEEEEEEEADHQEEETLSLCDFPLNSGDDPDKRDSSKIINSRRSSSEPSDFFEFFNDFTSDNMSHAEDIIFCGKLLPTAHPHPRRPRILKSLSEHDAADHFSRSYCHYSLPEEFNPTTPNGVASTRRLPRGGCPKFRRRSSSALLVKPEPSDIHRSLSKSSAKSDGSAKVAPKPRWFVLMFGPLRLQPEMDLRDMKNRQVRRNPGSMFPGMDGGGGRRSSWGHDLLRVLSCKNHASVAVTASIGLVPHF